MSALGTALAEKDSQTECPAIDVARIREDFPVLKELVHGKPLVYLDNAASTQKPQSVIDAIDRIYSKYYSNIHRGVHLLSQKSTDAYEAVRTQVKQFINAGSEKEIVYVRNATEAINLVASSYGRKFIKEGDEIIVSAMEHHANIVPWQILCEEKGAVLRVIPMNDDGELLMDEFEKLLGPKTRFVSIVHLSNALGTINPIKKIIDRTHAIGAPVLIDAAQSAPHIPLDVQALDCDFLVFSGHKVYGPTGIGALYGKADLLDSMPPYQGGGDMISYVSFEKTLYNDIPYKFEAGTPNIAGTIGLGAAIDYLTGIGMDRIAAHEEDLLNYATQAVSEIPELTVIGRAKQKAGVLSFILENVHPHDIGTIVDQEGVAIRTGHHCAQPVMDRFNIPATARASFGIYNTKEEIDVFIDAVKRVLEVFA